jgi:ABC-2 type transport system permease protein
MNTFSWLLKREYWEHRGGFFWTPFWISATILIFTLLGIIWAEVYATRINVSVGVSLESITQMVSTGQIEQAGKALDAAYVSFAMVPCIALFFVLFFYLLGALYDDRRDRSVLFWKSLPVSDTATVLSKVISAMFVAPLIALLVSTIAFALFLVVIGTWAGLHGINPLPLLAASHPFSLFGRMLLSIPADAAWALPVGGDPAGADLRRQYLDRCAGPAEHRPFGPAERRAGEAAVRHRARLLARRRHVQLDRT